MTPSKAYLYLIKLLSSRDYSEHKLRSKLNEKKFEQTEIDKAITSVKEKNYLREDLYKEARTKAFISKGYSKKFIKNKLKIEKLTIEDDQLSDIYLDNHQSEEEQVLRLFHKKGDRLDLTDPKNVAKIIRFALSKGHDYGLIKKVLLHYKESINVDD